MANQHVPNHIKLYAASRILEQEGREPFNWENIDDLVRLIWSHAPLKNTTVTMAECTSNAPKNFATNYTYIVRVERGLYEVFRPEHFEAGLIHKDRKHDFNPYPPDKRILQVLIYKGQDKIKLHEFYDRDEKRWSSIMIPQAIEEDSLGTGVYTIRLSRELDRRLAIYSELVQQPRERIITDAINEYLDKYLTLDRMQVYLPKSLS